MQEFYVLLMAILVHLPRAMGHEAGLETMAANMDREKELEMVNVFRNIKITGALMGFAKFTAKRQTGDWLIIDFSD